jgi:hypothetical protein
VALVSLHRLSLSRRRAAAVASNGRATRRRGRFQSPRQFEARRFVLRRGSVFKPPAGGKFCNTACSSALQLILVSHHAAENLTKSMAFVQHTLWCQQGVLETRISSRPSLRTCPCGVSDRPAKHGRQPISMAGKTSKASTQPLGEALSPKHEAFVQAYVTRDERDQGLSSGVSRLQERRGRPRGCSAFVSKC